MFKKEPIKYALAERVVQGETRQKTDSVDYSMIAIWRIGGVHIHYSRIADVVIPYPPVETNERFYCSHSSDAIYYLSKKDGKQCIVVVYL